MMETKKILTEISSRLVFETIWFERPSLSHILPKTNKIIAVDDRIEFNCQNWDILADDKSVSYSIGISYQNDAVCRISTDLSIGCAHYTCISPNITYISHHFEFTGLK